MIKKFTPKVVTWWESRWYPETQHWQMNNQRTQQLKKTVKQLESHLADEKEQVISIECLVTCQKKQRERLRNITMLKYKESLNRAKVVCWVKQNKRIQTKNQPEINQRNLEKGCTWIYRRSNRKVMEEENFGC